jgi:hypothetical protein
MDRQTLVLQKLLKVAETQQQAIKKIAQEVLSAPSVAEHHPLIDYINNGLIAVAAANLGIPGVGSEVKVNSPAPAVGNINQGGETYTAYITGVPEKRRDAFAKVLSAQLKLQKPELDGKFSYFFKD